MNTRIKLTTKILPETSLTIEDLSQAYGTTKGKIIDDAIKRYAESDSGSSKTDDLDVMRKQLNRLQEQNEHLLNLLNSMCVVFGYDSKEFAPADTKPSKWLQESKNIHHQLMLKKKTDKLIKESEYH